MNLLLTFLFILFVFIFGIIPFWVLYRISDFIYLLMFKVFGYRKKVIVKNLKETFTSKSEKEIKELLPGIYKNLTDIIIEGIKAFTMTKRQINRRFKILNPEILKPYHDTNQSLIGITGHICNWEWGSLAASLQINHNVIALYKPLSNKWVDKFMRWNRSRTNTILASIYETSDTFEKYHEKSSVFLMAADQSPARGKSDKAIWVNFLGRDTAFLYGPEKYSKKHNLPIIFIDIKRIKRGFYEIELSELISDPYKMKEGEITSMYAQKLESVIQDQPKNWLWSHKRWKLSR